MKKIIVLILFFSNFLIAQSDFKIEDRYWLGFGSEVSMLINNGLLPSENNFGLGLHLGANYGYKSSKYQVRFSYFPTSIFNSVRIREYGILYGIGKVKRGYHYMLSGGISIFDVDVENKRFNISIPIEFEFLLKATDYGGFGWYIMTNLGYDMIAFTLGGRFVFGKVK